MITEEEKTEIINLAVEKALLMLPDVVANLAANHSEMMSIKKEFFEKNKDLVDHKDITASVIESIESQNPGMSYREVLRKSIPIIRDRLLTVKGLDVSSAPRPTRRIPSLSTSSNNGEL